MLQVKNLNVKFSNKELKTWNEVIHDINFNIEQGKVLGIVGESGSGKSVSSFAITRLIDENKSKIDGEILFENINLLDLSETEIRKYRGSKIGFIFQEPMTSLNPVMTCGEQAKEAILLHQKVNSTLAKSKTIELFNEVKLPRADSIYNSYPHQLSGGQKQRVMIAMALSCNPKLLIADEPTTALDVTIQKTIIVLLKQLIAKRNMSMIFISHDLSLVHDIADDIIVMYKGKIVEKGTAEEVFKSPKNAYTKGLLACRPSPLLNLKYLPTIADFLDDINYKNTFNSSSNQITKDETEQRRISIYHQKPLLQVNNLCTWFIQKKSFFAKDIKYVKAVNNVTFDVFTGETLGLVGESGCGKSTLGRTILRLIEAKSGSIQFEGKDLLSINKKQMQSIRKDIQLIFQDPYSALNPRITIGDSILEPLKVHRILNTNEERKKYVFELLEKVNLLPEHYYRYPHEFSGGQRQRIVIARALALKPKLLICDESVSALDVSVQAQVLNLLRSLQNEYNLTYIFISHDLNVVKHISDRIIVMNKGKIEEIGFAEEIYTNPKMDYTKQLINTI